MKDTTGKLPMTLFDVGMMGIPGFCGIYIIRGDCDVLIDAGTRECAGNLINHLEENDIKPRYIFITHNHHDHIGALTPLLDHFGRKSITVITGREGKKRLENPNEINRLYTETVFESVSNIKIMEDGEVLSVGGLNFQVIYTPGHSDDSISVFETTTGTIFPGDLTGDWLWNSTYLGPHVTPDFSEKKMLASTERLLALDIRHTALTHFGIISGPESREIFRKQLDRYYEWKSILTGSYGRRGDYRDMIPDLKQFLQGSPFERLDAYDAVIEAFAHWCEMGFRANGSI